ncbi:MAG: efflux RND transporter permease subunit, partial [Verrucomicrobiota bacterium]
MADPKHSEPDKASQRSGPIDWFCRHPVAANLLMVIFIVGGLINAFQIKQEVFPNVTPDIITVAVPYPGAGPEEVEEGVVIPIESAVRGIDGVKQVRSSSGEGRGTVLVELLSGTDRQSALNDVKNEIDRITSFPEEAEEPIISLPDNQVHVISLMVYGELSRRTLYQISEDLRRDLLNEAQVTQVDIRGLPAPEISIEIPQENLRRFGLTLPELARRIDAASLELPSGSIETRGGELRLRVTEEREFGSEFAQAAVFKLPDGSQATLADLGAVIDTFRDTDERAYFEGLPAAQLQIYRVADQTPVGVAQAVQNFVEQKRAELPESVKLATWNDRSQLYENRVGLLIENAAIGVVLVLAILGIFLRPQLAFWVTLGIPISFLGAFLLLPSLDASINMISLFAFLLVLGIVVDDAIVIGEAIHRRQMQGEEGVAGAVSG